MDSGVLGDFEARSGGVPGTSRRAGGAPTPGAGPEVGTPGAAAGVAFAALHWDLAAWQREVKRRHDSDPRTTAQSTLHFPWVMGCRDMSAAIEKAARFSLAGVAERIACPFLVVHADDDRVRPLRAGRRHGSSAARRRYSSGLPK